MSKFENVNVITHANIYYDGKVTSRTLEFADGTSKTLGIMLPGSYHFSTGVAEIMTIQQGSVHYRLSDLDGWIEVSAGESFDVPANASFDIKMDTVVDYCCSYVVE